MPGPSIYSGPVFFQGIFSLAPIPTHLAPKLLPKSVSDVNKDKLNQLNQLIRDTENRIKGVMTLLRRHGIELLLPGIPR